MSSLNEENDVDTNNNNPTANEEDTDNGKETPVILSSKEEEEVVNEAIVSESPNDDSKNVVSEEEEEEKDDDDDDTTTTTTTTTTMEKVSKNSKNNSHVWKQRQSVLRKHLTNGFIQLSERQQLKKSKRHSQQPQPQTKQEEEETKKHHVVIHILDPTQSTSSNTLLSTRGRIPSYTTNRNTSSSSTTTGGGPPTKIITTTSPTTTTTTTTSTTTTMTQKGTNPIITSNNILTGGGPSLDLYKKLTTIFERDYHSTLHGVPYPNIRTGTKELIDSIPCKPSMITHSSSSLLHVQTNPMDWHLGPYCHVYIAACESIEHYRARVRPAIQAFISQVQESIPTSSSISNNNNNNSSSSSTNNNNNANSSNNHSSSNSSSHANSSNNNTSPPYVIVYVPLSKRSQDDKDGHSSSSNSQKSQAQQLSGLIRSKISRGNMRSSPPSSHHGGGDELTFTNTESMEDDASINNKFAMAAAAPPPGPIFQSKKDVKELHKKFCHDFPYGRTCILSTLLASSEDSYSPLKNQEWNAFLRALGDAIVCGFRQRVDRYNAELNKQQVTTYVQKFQSTKKLDESHFFLVKESLAFTFEQMQLQHQALLVYEELEAFLPQDAIWMEEEELVKKNKREMKKMASQQNIKLKKDADDDTGITLYDIASAGDCAAFRRRIGRAATEFKLWSHLILQYLFARQTHLLFQLERPVDIIMRAYTFVRSMYQLRLDAILLLSSSSSGKNYKEEELATLKIQKQAEAEAWALHTCWDIKCACDVYFSWTEEEREASCRLSDVLSFARLRLLKLGDLELSQNPIRMAMSNRPQDTKTPWLSLQELQTQQQKEIATTTTTSNYHNSISLLQLENPETPPSKPPPSISSSMPPDIAASGILENSMMDQNALHESNNSNMNMMSSSSLQTSKRSRTNMGLKYTGGWLRGAFDSREAYELKYLELSKSIITLLEKANRFRSAARLQGEEAEIYILRGEYEKAVSTLLPVVDNCAADFWDRAYYWRLFRLACCQRIVSFQQQQQKQQKQDDNESTLLYLQTLTRCFNPRLALVAPEKTSLLLFHDLAHVVGCQDIPENHRLGISPFLETEICVDNNHRATQTLPYIRRRIYQQFCFVGDTFQLSIIVKSHLPQSITLDGVRLFIVSLNRFEEIHTTGSNTITEQDAYRILHVPEDKIVINPGENTLDLDWIPMAVGEYALAAVSLKWKHVDIIHESSRLRKPMSGVDVLPSEPTQNMDLNPLFLIPGHTQNVRLLFEAGSDIVEKGSVDLTCSPGLQLLSPTSGEGEGEEEWVNTLSLDLEACQPDSKIVITTTVKSDPIQAYDEHGSSSISRRRESKSAIQTMHAKVTTSYYHSLYTELTSVKKEEPEAPSMTTILEAMVTTLDRPALTVGRAEAMNFSEDHVMVHVCLHCNTPVPFYLHEWSITFPPPLRVDQEFNQNLFGHTVVEGEELFFGFRCLRMDTHHYDNHTDDTTTITTTSSVKEEEDRPVLQVILRDEFGKTFRQVLPLDLYDFYEWMKQEDACSNMNTVQAQLQSSQTEGVVGSPVIFQYHVDTSMLTTIKRRMSLNYSDTNLDNNKSKTLLFQIRSNPSDWILGGKVQGLIPLSASQSTYSLEFTGIPTRSGLLNRFPEISLLHHYPDNVSSSTPASIKVQTKHPDSFKSLSYTNHMALACPSTLEC